MLKLSLCRFLTNAGANVEDLAWGESGGWRSALHIASEGGHVAFVKYLLELNPARVHSLTNPGLWTPLCSAAIGGQTAVVRVRSALAIGIDVTPDEITHQKP